MTINLDEIGKLLGEITQGDRGIDPYGPRYSISSKVKPFRHITMVSCYAKMADDEKENKANASLIAAAPTIIRESVAAAEVRGLRGLVEEAYREGHSDGYVDGTSGCLDDGPGLAVDRDWDSSDAPATLDSTEST